MARFSKLIGIMGNLWRIGGMGGVVLKFSSGMLHVRNSGDTGDTSIRASRPQFTQNAAAGRVLVSDASGFGNWTDPGTSGGAAQWYAGDIKASAQSADHGKWLKCDGRAVSRTTYATLFAAVGGAFGAGDGSTTFNIPDATNRFLRGPGNGYGVGSMAGNETYTLTQDHLPVDTLIAAGTSRVVVTTTGTTTFIQRKSSAPYAIEILPKFLGVNFFVYTG